MGGVGLGFVFTGGFADPWLGLDLSSVFTFTPAAPWLAAAGDEVDGGWGEDVSSGFPLTCPTRTC